MCNRIVISKIMLWCIFKLAVDKRYITINTKPDL
jgi:hypothetical protein